MSAAKTQCLCDFVCNYVCNATATVWPAGSNWFLQLPLYVLMRTWFDSFHFHVLLLISVPDAFCGVIPSIETSISRPTSRQPWLQTKLQRHPLTYPTIRERDQSSLGQTLPWIWTKNVICRIAIIPLVSAATDSKLIRSIKIGNQYCGT